MNEFHHSMLPAAARLVVPVQYVFSIYLLLRGHNLPGGGFIGGLVLASALVLRAMVDPKRVPKFDLIRLSGIGLLVALLSAVLPWLTGKTFFTGLWGGQIWLPALGDLKLGTPLLFDIGVFLVVTGVAAKLLLVLLSQTQSSIKIRRDTN
ncbi:MAG: Na(+)/H(+) antiporter subunit B [Verrucomicrobiaceae bacterium]|nr:MAG: Na(+)/H(+) antiporter subunit B [Verrucomicrobiaceae bacterium]